MSFSMKDLGLDRLGMEDRMALAYELWESVEREAEQLLPTGGQRAELERRLADSLVHPDAVVRWAEVKARALARAKQ